MRRPVISLVVAILLASTAPAQTETTELPDLHPVPLSGFAEAVSMDGNALVVGARLTSVSGVASAGQAYMYRKTGGTWKFDAELKLAVPELNDEFGTSVSLSGDLLVVGAPELSGANTGRAWVFRRTAGAWNVETELVPSTASLGSAAGTRVAVDGNTVLIYAENPLGLPTVTAFESLAGVWSETAILTSPVSGNDFGSAVSLRGDIAVIGAGDETVSGELGAGAVYIFRRTGLGWVQEFKLTEQGPTAAHHFGREVAFDGSRILVGVDQASVEGIAGAGRLYFYGQPGFGTWALDQELENPNAFGTLGFGAKVAIEGSLGLASYGPNEVGTLRFEGGKWFAEPTFRPAAMDAVGNFGLALALSSGDAAIGGSESGPLPQANSAYTFTLGGGKRNLTHLAIQI